MMDDYQKMARALAPALRGGVTFTRAWFMAREHMTSSFWRHATGGGLVPHGYVATAGDVSGQGRKLLTVMPCDAPGAPHLVRDEKDGGSAFRVTPFGRFTYR